MPINKWSYWSLDEKYSVLDERKLEYDFLIATD